MYQYYGLYLAWWWLSEPKHVAKFLIFIIDYQFMLCLWRNKFTILSQNTTGWLLSKWNFLFFLEKNSARYNHRNTQTFMCFCSVLTELEISKQIFMQLSIMNFHENPSCGSRRHTRQMCPVSARPLKYSRAIPRCISLARSYSRSIIRMSK